MNTIQGAKYLWRVASVDQQQALTIAAKYNLSLPVAATLVGRGYTTPDAIENYLFSSPDHVAHPSLLKDASRAVERIIEALNKKEKILIAGDYDVDGITSSALMMICLVPLDARVNFFLPHRVHDGYGLSTKVVQRAFDNGYRVIMTVDNGITAFEPAALAKKLGIDLIITDHHRPHDHVPDAYAIINPHQHDCPYPYKKFAGVGVGFKLMTLLYEKLGLPMPSKAYELLLLGTVADVVPLTGENRYWVRHGLTYVNGTESNSLRVLKQNGNFKKPTLSSLDVGFLLAPQLNALGRLEDPRHGVKFLIGTDVEEVTSVGRVLYELNQARKDIERSIFAQVVEQIEKKSIDLDHELCIIAASSSWPPGVIGLVASRLVGAYGKPTILLHITRDGIAKGSCRSISAFNMFDALHDARDLLTTFGGHSVAAGLSLPIDNIPALKQHIEQRIRTLLTPEDLKQKLTIDAGLYLSDVTTKFMKDVDYLQPFGSENPQPTFLLDDVSLVQKPQLLKDAHVKCSVFAHGIIKPLIFFNRPELFEILMQLEREQRSFKVAAQVSENHWNDMVSLELLGVDIAYSQGA